MGAGVICVAYNHDGSRLAAGFMDGFVTLFAALQGYSAIKTLLGHAGCVYSVAFGTGGDVLASGGEDASVRL